MMMGIQEKTGFIPNVFLGLAHRPEELRVYGISRCLNGTQGGLSKAEREMIVVATSGANDCLYCVVAHGAILRIRAKSIDCGSTRYRPIQSGHRRTTRSDDRFRCQIGTNSRGPRSV